MNLLKSLDTATLTILVIATCVVGLFVAGCTTTQTDVELAACSGCGKIVWADSPYTKEYLDTLRAGKRWYCPDCRNRGSTVK